MRELKLVAGSAADDLGFVALADISRIIAAQGLENECRLIGGHMVTLHVRRWGLGHELYRETTDADLGIATVATNRTDPVELLKAEGYEKVSGSRFERQVSGQTEPAIIDVLVPTYKSRARKSVKVGNLVTTEVGGLATALQRPAVSVALSMHRLSGEELNARLPLPDEPSCFVLKAFAYESRSSGKDAVDLWRCLEILHEAEMPIAEESGDDFKRARHLVASGFQNLGSPMMEALVKQRQLNRQAAQQQHTRIKALMKSVGIVA